MPKHFPSNIAAPVKLSYLSVKQRKFLVEYLKTGDATAAVYGAGYNPSTRKSAQVHASKLMKSLQGNIQLLLEEAGIDDMRIVKLLNEGLNLGVDHRNTPKYLDTSLKLKGYLGKGNEDMNTGGLVVNVVNYNNYTTKDDEIVPVEIVPENPHRASPVRVIEENAQA